MKIHLIHFCRFVGIAVLLLSGGSATADLIHRYSFTSDASDSVGTAHATTEVVGDAFGPTPGTQAPIFLDGQALFDGMGGYIDLPNGIVSGLQDVTFETWVTWYGGGAWQRIFDIGNTTTGEQGPDGAVGTGTSYLFLCFNAANSGQIRFTLTDNSNGAERPVVDDPVDTPQSDVTNPATWTEVYVTVTYSSSTGTANLYIDGQLVDSGTAANPVQLSDIDDVNNWLGRSQWADPLAFMAMNDFRIHDNVLSSAEIAASNLGGPDSLSYDPGTVDSVTLSVQSPMVIGTFQTPQMTASYSIVGELALSPGEVTLESSDTGIIQISPAGLLEAVGAGTATITVTAGGQMATGTVVVAAPEDRGPPYLEDGNGLTSIEAENYHRSFGAPDGHTWTLQTERAGFSGEGYMQAVPDGGSINGAYPGFLSASPRLDYQVLFSQPGTHYVWILGGDPTDPDGAGAGNSMHFGINGDNPESARRIDGAPDFNSVTWNWVGNIQGDTRATLEVPTAGLHTLNAWMREDGFQFDKLVVTTDPAFTPTDSGPAESGRAELSQDAADSLVHRYSFTSDASDAVGDADGQAVAFGSGSPPAFSGGKAVLGGSGGYIDLPNGIVSSLTELTIETWVTVNNNANWARIFDFGTSTTGELGPGDAVGTGMNYMFVTANGAGSNSARFAITAASNGGESPVLIDPNPFPIGEEVHLAVSYGTTTATLYINGTGVASGDVTIPLSLIVDNNVWLGRSQWNDPAFNGSFNEFRVYSKALAAGDLAASFAAGPDNQDLPGPPPAQSTAEFTAVTLSDGMLTIEWTGGGTLERASSVLGPWAAVAGATSPHRTPTDQTAQVFRVRQ